MRFGFTIGAVDILIFTPDIWIGLIGTPSVGLLVIVRLGSPEYGSKPSLACDLRGGRFLAFGFGRDEKVFTQRLRSIWMNYESGFICAELYRGIPWFCIVELSLLP